MKKTFLFFLALLFAGWRLPAASAQAKAQTPAPEQGPAQATQVIDETKTKEVSFLNDLDLTKNHFESETRAGVIFTSGNTDSLSVSGNHKTIYRIKRVENTWRLNAYFNRVTGSNAGTPTGTIAQYVSGAYRLDYYFLPRTTVFAGTGGYSDELKGVNVASDTFAGISHYLLLTRKHSLRGELGYDFTYEDRIAPAANEAIHSVTSNLKYLWRINERVQFLQAVDAKQNVEIRQDFRLNTDTELKVNLHKRFALVVGFHLRLDNDPVDGFEKADTISDLSLAVTF